jgi:putative tryptophan/tyrosine transport system substrate-binding protein
MAGLRSHRTRRRTLLCAAAVAMLSSRLSAQTRPHLPRVGVLTAAHSDKTPILQAFRKGLAEHGYEDGRNVVLEFRITKGDYTLFPGMVADLLATPVDVILVDGGSAAAAAITATNSLPIVMGTAGDPVANGWVASLSRREASRG